MSALIELWKQQGLRQRYNKVKNNAKQVSDALAKAKEDEEGRRRQELIDKNEKSARDQLAARAAQGIDDLNSRDTLDDIEHLKAGHLPPGADFNPVRVLSSIIIKGRDAVAHGGQQLINKTPEKPPNREQPPPPKKQRPNEEVDPVGGHIPMATMDQEMPEANAPNAESTPSNGGTAGGQMISGGMRSGVARRNHTNKVTVTVPFTKDHVWMIKQVNESMSPTYNTGTNYQVRILKSRWYEVPDNEFGFYMDKAEMDYIQHGCRFYRVKSATWKIESVDIMSKNTLTPGSTTPQTTLNSGYQPKLEIARSTDCMPPYRSRYWCDPLGVEAAGNDNTYSAAFSRSGTAHQRMPTYLPRVDWILNMQNLWGTALAPPTTDPDPLETYNVASMGGDNPHIDILANCSEEYEMEAEAPFIDKKPYKFWRTNKGTPYYHNVIGRGTTGIIYDASLPCRSTTVGQKRYDTPAANRSLQPNALVYGSEDNDWLRYTSTKSTQQMWKNVIGPDKYIYHQYRNSTDNYFPHLENGLDNKPTFLAMSLLPKSATDVWEYQAMIRIKSVIVIEMDTPFLFPFNNSPWGNQTTVWSGDDRTYFHQNDITGRLAPDLVRGYTINRTDQAVCNATDAIAGNWSSNVNNEYVRPTAWTGKENDEGDEEEFVE